MKSSLMYLCNRSRESDVEHPQQPHLVLVAHARDSFEYRWDNVNDWCWLHPTHFLYVLLGTQMLFDLVYTLHRLAASLAEER